MHADLRHNWKNKILRKRWLKEVIASFNLKTGNIQIISCTDEYLLDVNKKFLQHDYYTDIITFDESEKDVINGDLIISIERVRENAEQYGVSTEEELNRVIVHGILHLVGFRDKSEKEISTMRKEENKALSALKGLTV
ncbi:MAG: rRNA maturation RNase YbeY [Bacteroidetes bacterium]|nr:rRNA maturation RNase YbeY [Bacteroidota bacterium]